MYRSVPSQRTMETPLPLGLDVDGGLQAFSTPSCTASPPHRASGSHTPYFHLSLQTCSALLCLPLPRLPGIYWCRTARVGRFIRVWTRSDTGLHGSPILQGIPELHTCLNHTVFLCLVYTTSSAFPGWYRLPLLRGCCYW